MDDWRRLALYYTPPAGGALAEFGARWLGWDIAAGAPIAQPAIAGLDLTEITAAPRRYGFHGTLKPPFRPTEGLGAVIDAVAHLARGLAPVAAPPLRLSRIGGFLALVPAAPSPALADLAAACVAGLDHLRAHADAAELDKRRAAGLSPVQEALLRRWGYPFVMAEFRFHLTLTGRLSPTQAEAAEAALAPRVAPLCAAPLAVRDIALCGEAEDGRFHLVRRFALGG